LIDGAGNRPEVFLRAVRLLRELAAKHPPVLVHCYAGRSRSAAVVCKFLMIEEGNSLVAAMRRITSKRKVAIAAALQDFLDLK
jgi:protein-tyrosine phosphatase